MIHGAHGGHGFFLVATLEILEEIFFKMLLTQEMNHRIIGI